MKGMTSAFFSCATVEPLCVLIFHNSVLLLSENKFPHPGLTEMNIFLGSSHYGSPGFKDPGKFDTRLAPRGIAQAESLNSRLQKEAATWSANKDEAIDLVVCSPLSRALHTASLAFAGEQLQKVPRVVHAGIRERIWLTSDVGKSPDELTAAWSQQGWDFSGLEQTWWYTDENWKRDDTDWQEIWIFFMLVDK